MPHIHESAFGTALWVGRSLRLTFYSMGVIYAKDDLDKWQSVTQSSLLLAGLGGSNPVEAPNATSHLVEYVCKRVGQVNVPYEVSKPKANLKRVEEA